MNNEEIRKIVKDVLPEQRYEHTLGVAEAAIELGARFAPTLCKTSLERASLVHDYKKPYGRVELTELLQKYEPNEDFSSYGGVLLHGPVAAYLLKEDFGIEDEEIFHAVYYHTTGRPKMSLFEKIIFLADFIEPGRHFPGVHDVRKVAEKDLNLAVLESLRSTIQHLSSKHVLIHPLTLSAYNDQVRTAK
ncbi:hypothetical protein DH09_07950 [Bacillaceae bacterium JMAK1]|nr:hypothetical protein DH09_07950 [Bacillaceae bacterium JMAK1]